MDHGDRFLNLLPALLRRSVRRDIPLRDLTTLKVGGPAALVCPVHTPEEAAGFQMAAAGSGLPWFVLGGGSNVLADDRGFGGVILRLEGRSWRQDGHLVTADAGLPLDELVAGTLAARLTGLEFASGIPGTLGGALAGNAGCYGREIGDLVREVTLLTREGAVVRAEPGACGFRYRGTSLRDDGAVVLQAVLALGSDDLQAALAERAEHLADRAAKHPVDLPSAGSWFRNLEPAEPGGRRRAAGVLLEQAGAKAMREGDAGVFPRHANIIVNLGRARSDDIRRLAARMREAVHERFGVTLLEEVRYLDPDAPPGRLT